VLVDHLGWAADAARDTKVAGYAAVQAATERTLLDPTDGDPRAKALIRALEK
jgi:hypothetical protein